MEFLPLSWGGVQTMNEMIEFCTAILGAICDFLVEPPIFYLFSLICFAVIVGIVRSLLRNH